MTSKSADLSVVRTLFVGVSLTASLAASPVMAQTSDEKAAADALFDAARDLMNAEEYAAACPKFQDSHDLDPAVGTLLNLGLCYKKAGQTASAWTTYMTPSTAIGSRRRSPITAQAAGRRATR